jgi:hypothetical protein
MPGRSYVGKLERFEAFAAPVLTLTVCLGPAPKWRGQLIGDGK